MYYKAQMGGREREKREEGKREGDGVRAAVQALSAGRLCQDLSELDIEKQQKSNSLMCVCVSATNMSEAVYHGCASITSEEKTFLCEKRKTHTCKFERGSTVQSNQ